MPLPAPSLTRRAAFWWLAFAAWFALLFVLSSIPNSSGNSPPFVMSDKVAHLCYFAAGATGFALALSMGRGRGMSRRRLFAACLVMAAIVGWFDEWHQSFTPGRDGNSLGDWIADVLGGGAGFALAMLLLPRLRRDAVPCSFSGNA